MFASRLTARRGAWEILYPRLAYLTFRKQIPLEAQCSTRVTWTRYLPRYVWKRRGFHAGAAVRRDLRRMLLTLRTSVLIYKKARSSAFTPEDSRSVQLDITWRFAILVQPDGNPNSPIPATMLLSTRPIVLLSTLLATIDAAAFVPRLVPREDLLRNVTRAAQRDYSLCCIASCALCVEHDCGFVSALRSRILVQGDCNIVRLI